MTPSTGAHTRRMNGSRTTFVTTLWDHLGGSPELPREIEIDGPDVVLPSVFDVTGFAASTVAVANLAAAELWAIRTDAIVPTVSVHRRAASAAFACERVLTANGWELPPVWDPIAGDYETSDGWIRLHTNYSYHRDAVTTVLGVPADHGRVAAAALEWSADDLERAVVDAGGCAAVLRTADAWRAHPAGAAAVLEPPIALTTVGRGGSRSLPTPERPLSGVRVLDLTRVIAGPVATRFLASHGADVVRIDPPGFEEVGALLPETTRGKRCTALDLRSGGDRETFERLVVEADVVVAGLRPGAMAGLGYDPDALRRINPSLITVHHSAYGWSGPWADRRGFDSLVQMSCGIAAAGAAGAGTDRPTPLPVQALDHGTGFLLAAATCRALAERARTGIVSEVRASLVGAANVLMSHPTPSASAAGAPTWTDADAEPATTHWGPVRCAPIPGSIDGHPAAFDPARDAGPLGRHEARFGDAVSAVRAG